MLMNRIIAILVLMLVFSSASSKAADLQHEKVNKTIYVSTAGHDQANGSLRSPFKTIQRAVDKAQPGDKVLVATGIYRESVFFKRGGISEQKRIILEGSGTGRVLLKGSDRITNWVREKDNLWRCVLGTTYPAMAMHIDGKKMVRCSSMQDCDKLFGWSADLQKGKTVLTANFGDLNPNKAIIELAIREVGITADKQVDFVTIKGIDVSQIANPYASIYGRQPGAIDTKNGRHWQIFNCSVSECLSVGISIGVTGHSYPEVSPRKPEFSDYNNIDSVGHHDIKGNHIFNCGQAGIFGLLGGSSSRIEDNLIENINQDLVYKGSESAGIRLAMAVDVVIEHNLIRGTWGANSYGIYMGPIFQNARLSRNILTGSGSGLIYLFKNHGPVLIDNNILFSTDTSRIALKGVNMEASEANVFVQNLFYNTGFINARQSGRSVSTSNFLPHSLTIKQTIPALNIDHRWFGNVFVGRGLMLQKLAGLEVDYNHYSDGANPVSWADQHSLRSASQIFLKLQHHRDGVDLILNNLKPMKMPVFSAEYLGFFALSKQFLSYPNGGKISVDKDFLGVSKTGSTTTPGPFYQNKTHKQKIKLF